MTCQDTLNAAVGKAQVYIINLIKYIIYMFADLDIFEIKK